MGGGGGLRIKIKNLTYHVASNKNKRERAYLLKEVSGWFESMQMAALMGPSGSGKTTLLDLLAGRKTQGTSEGEIQFGGTKPSPQFLRKYTGYVEQFDTLLPILTVEEMLMYTAELKRPRTEPILSKQAAVARVLTRLALDGCKDVVIGSQLVKGISGGQAKRTNIAIAMITNPRVLFLDEPTSGLDSYTANEVMAFVKQLTKDGTTICATIHSPTQFCFQLFDSLMMLVRGRIVYFGPTGDGATFAQQACPGVNVRSLGYNDAEFIVDLMTECDLTGKGDQVANYYESSDLKAENDAQLKAFMSASSRDLLSEGLQAELSTLSSTVTPWWWGLWILFRYRTLRNYSRIDYLGPRIFDKIFVGLLIMTLYLGIGDNFSPGNLINICAVLFMFVVMPAFGAAAYTPALVLERPLFVRERSDGLYYVITYLLSKMVEELLIACLASLGVTAFVFYGIKLQGSWVFFWLTYLTTLSNGIILAYLIASFSPSLEVANALLPTYVVTLLFFAGFLFRLQDIPPWWKWNTYIDFLRYAFGGLMVNQFSANNPPWQGSNLLQYYDFYHVDKWTYLGYLSLFFIVFFSLTWVTMTFKKYSSR